MSKRSYKTAADNLRFIYPIGSNPTESEAFIRAMIEGTSDVVFVKNREGRYLLISTAGARLFRREMEDILGRSDSELFPESTAQQMLGTDRQVLESENVQTFEETLFIEGQSHILLTTKGPYRSSQGDVIGILGISHDITNRKYSEEQRIQLISEQIKRSQAEEAYKHAKFLADAASALDSSLDYAITLQTVAKLAIPTLADFCWVDIIKDSRQIQRVAVAFNDPSIGHWLKELQSQFPPSWDSPHLAVRVIRSGMPEVIPSAHMSHMKEFTVSQQHLDLIGKLKLTSIMTVPLISRLKVLGAMTLGLIRPDRHYNLSDLKFVEELANRAAIAIDNAGLYRDAQEAIQVRDEFLSIASHELRTPITPLMLQLQAMLRMANRNSHGMLTQDELVKGIKKIERQTERLSRLVDELLNVSRLRAGRMNLNLETFDLSQLIRDIVERYRVELEKSHCVPILHLESSMLVYWDPLRIEEAIVNLLENAMKFGKSKPIDISLTLKNEEVELSVKDQGMGISAQDQKRIFERFERAVSITEYGGFGLGLYITRKIVEGHGGSIQVESHLGKGSIFTIHLPARAASDQLQAA